MALIEIVGSSTPNGFGDAEGGQAARTKRENYARREEVGMQHEIGDWSCSAQTTDDSKERVELSIKQRANYRYGKILVGYFGPYDACINLEADLDPAGQPQTMVPEDVFAGNVEEICLSALRSGSHVRLVGLPPLADDHALIGKKERYDERYRGHFEQIQRRIVKTIALQLALEAESKVTIDFIPVYYPCLRLMSRMRDAVDRDMVHPATAIHELMWQMVMRDHVLPLADVIDLSIFAERKAAREQAASANAAAQAAALAAGGVILVA